MSGPGDRPTSGPGYLYAPLKGPKAPLIEKILSKSGEYPQIAQRKVQLLLWAILARTKFHEMKHDLQSVASQLLTQEEIAQLELGSLEAYSDRAMKSVLRKAPRAVRRTLEAEAKIRRLLADPNAAYEELERIAVLPPGLRQKAGKYSVPLGRWSIHPDGYFIRYFPQGYSKVRIQVFNPEPVVIERDGLGRITLFAGENGARIETEYDDSIEPLTIPGDPGVKGYAFRRIRFVRPDPADPELFLEAEWLDTGWTLVGTPNGRGRPESPSTQSRASWRRWSFGFRELPPQRRRFPGAREAYGRANDVYGRVTQLKQWGDNNTRSPSQKDVQDLTNTAHYRDGLGKALGSNLQEKGEWVSDHTNIVERAFNYASCSIVGACGGGGGGKDEGKKKKFKPGGMAFPGKQKAQPLGQGTGSY